MHRQALFLDLLCGFLGPSSTKCFACVFDALRIRGRMGVPHTHWQAFSVRTKHLVSLGFVPCCFLLCVLDALRIR